MRSATQPRQWRRNLAAHTCPAYAHTDTHEEPPQTIIMLRSAQECTRPSGPPTHPKALPSFPTLPVRPVSTALPFPALLAIPPPRGASSRASVQTGDIAPHGTTSLLLLLLLLLPRRVTASRGAHDATDTLRAAHQTHTAAAPRPGPAALPGWLQSRPVLR